METPPALLLCLLLACSVWAAHGRAVKISVDEPEPEPEPEDAASSVEAGGLPGICWACKWALKKVKKVVGDNATAAALRSRLLSVCNEIGLLKTACRSFVKKNLGELIEELTTTDDVKTICINVRACKPKEDLDPLPAADTPSPAPDRSPAPWFRLRQ
ncbi:antimicrobial peptide NK-lysin-like [Salarias fasciatus]|nr:antimicrobial peptide NK-lysin-like [Salarias fasciatus]